MQRPLLAFLASFFFALRGGLSDVKTMIGTRLPLGTQATTSIIDDKVNDMDYLLHVWLALIVAGGMPLIRVCSQPPRSLREGLFYSASGSPYPVRTEAFIPTVPTVLCLLYTK